MEQLIFPPKREGRISRLLKPKLSHTGTCMSTNTRHVTLKSLKMSDNDNNQSHYILMNVLCRKKDIFADFSKSPK